MQFPERRAHADPARAARRSGRALLALLLTTAAGGARPAGAASPGDVYFLDQLTRGVVHIDLATEVRTPVAQGGNLATPMGLAYDPVSRGLLVADAGAATGEGTPGDGRIVRVDPDTGAQSVLSSGALFDPFKIAVEPTGNLLVLDGGRGLYRVDRGTGAASLLTPGAFGGLAVERTGHILLTDQRGTDTPFDGPGRVFRIDPVTGEGPLLSQGGHPHDITADRSGRIFVATGGGAIEEQIAEIDPATGRRTGVTLYRWVSGVATDDAGGLYYSVLPAFGASVVGRIDLATREFTQVRDPGGLAAQFRPYDVVVIPIPEPAAACLLAASAGWALLRRAGRTSAPRRRRGCPYTEM